MLRSLNELTGYTLQAEDGEIGRCKDFLLDAETWTIRYMVADTRKWLPGRKVLITPNSLGEADWEEQDFPVNLTREQIRNAPALDEDAPVTREYEIWWHEHFGWSHYWGAGTMSEAPPVRPIIKQTEPDLENPNLHSLDRLQGYNLQATDGVIGSVEDLIIEDSAWKVLYLAADTGTTFFTGKKVLIPTVRLLGIRWRQFRVEVGLSVDQIQNSPPFDPSQPVNRVETTRYYDYAGRPRD